ncbi:Glutamine-dependent NAD(+) synthetase [Pirellulimonas nuda]|uniref:Glutamine-dependent NAD(+) synthetase n=1 Tax=Pirellulimonas nuda TaxID=2528009 RepID=A0A518DGU0_9BACT|nr:NAD(+) synthase [Pirellulimonas nuda]QDU90652.1 Glutamine-dependent NAD(+) synthetase [Pirellulimonas nuda]
MQLIRLAAASLNQTPMDWRGNFDRMAAVIDAARRQGVGLLCLPELCVTAYGCEDMHFSPAVRSRALDLVQQLLPLTDGIAVAVGLPIAVGPALFNGQAMLVDGRLAGIVCKQHLANEGIHYEARWFERWPAGAVDSIEVDGRRVPVGDLLFDIGGVRVGIEICRDAWIAERTGIALARRGADVLLNPNASHFAFGKCDIRRRFVVEGSRTLGVATVHCNALGNESGRSIYDGDTMIAALGRLVASGPRFSLADSQLSSAVVDVAQLRQNRTRWMEAGRVGKQDAGLVAAPLEWPTVPDTEGASAPLGSASSATDAPWESGPHRKEEEFARAVTLGLFDYLRKSRANGFVVSLSGGVDSAAVATLCWLMVRLGVAELGQAGFAKRLPSVCGAQEAGDPRGLVRRLLTCVYQSTRQSGAATQNAARGVAEAIGAEFHLWSVDAMVDAFVGVVGEATGREIDWQTDDVALQNIQARARGPGVWLLANLKNALLLTTSNRSEASVGYATMDGDTCGGLAPVAGIDKHFLRHWLRWMETAGPAGVGPLPALAAINAQRPTAELRPAAAGQTDEADLMPYDVLDAIERSAIRDKRSPAEVLATLGPEFPQHERSELRGWVERFFKLWSANQWKRERYAPALHVDQGNVDPKTWCRFPILNGGFRAELEELEGG